MRRFCVSKWTRALALALGFLALLAGLASAQEVSAHAGFTRDRATVGESVQFQITISGAGARAEAPDIAVDGLDVQYIGPTQSSQMRIENGRMTSTSHLIHSYQVTPQRTGTFTVPALDIIVAGRRLRTQPATLRVEDAAGGNRSASSSGIDRVGFAQFLVPKETLYLGEAVSVELRLFVDSRVRWQLEAMPIIEGDGFTKTKLGEPRQERARKDGKEYDVLVFRTVITPSRAGRVALGPSEMVFNAQIPQQRRRERPRSLLEEMLGDDPFDDPFFAPMRVQRTTVKAPAVELEVKPLPANDRPRTFDGAVGDFKLSVQGSPNRVKIGDVVTMKLAVSGRGNFDRVNAPQLLDAAGWQTYPAKGAFKAEDDLGVSGTKTFEMAVIPETKKEEMPQFEFSYFDPAAEKYVTLSGGGGPIEVTGAPVSAPQPAATRAPPPKTLPAQAPAASSPVDIVGLRYDRDRIARSFRPLHEQRTFWIAQTIPLAILFGWLLMRTRRTDAAAKRISALRTAKAELWRKLRSRSEDAEFLDAAARFIRLETALATGCTEESVDAAVACASRPLDPAIAEAIDEVFNARAEILYAGDRGGGGTAVARDRARIISALETFERSRAKH